MKVSSAPMMGIKIRQYKDSQNYSLELTSNMIIKYSFTFTFMFFFCFQHCFHVHFYLLDADQCQHVVSTDGFASLMEVEVEKQLLIHHRLFIYCLK